MKYFRFKFDSFLASLCKKNSRGDWGETARHGLSSHLSFSPAGPWHENEEFLSPRLKDFRSSCSQSVSIMLPGGLVNGDCRGKIHMS